jgi:molecular chaperone GrpE
MAEPNQTSQQTAEPTATDLEALRARLDTAEQEREQFKALAARGRADFENYQKRSQREQAQERLYAQSPLAKDLLTPLDNLERAVAHAAQSGDRSPIVQGVTLVLTQMADLLRRHGIVRVDALGKPFDPNLHEAVMQQPSAEHPPMTVIQVFEPGYTIHDRVLRTARVAVASE